MRAFFNSRNGSRVERVKRSIEINCAPGFADRHPAVIEEMLQYLMTNPVPSAQIRAQMAAGAGAATCPDEIVDQRMRAIQVPTLVVFGEHDNVVPAGNAELMARRIPGAQFKVIPGVGHLFPLEDPEGTVAVTTEFLVGYGSKYASFA